MSQQQAGKFPKMTRGKIHLPIDKKTSQLSGQEQKGMGLSKNEHFGNLVLIAQSQVVKIVYHRKKKK